MALADTSLMGIMCLGCWRTRIQYLGIKRAVIRAFRSPRLHG